ncbi:exopolysaccharide biosynthesis protein [Falsirhodobacter halotolerans]|uniref:exopolysaccharide biosynthesis protein n=1 Tax=Falsirhodobacter halotolerans TaxID=1146892 RepID=UPI001FD6226D|nr:exopolysaccharide biosynthesis protein [Falsirhodobacter halotolerans]MCJ8140398.1 exopolysaccharide biosynthesis protein [Falsirhodobacter halotolerans]
MQPELEDPPRRRLSQVLEDIAHDPDRTRVSVADLVTAMQGRAFGALILIFALPNVIPTPPGTSAILGLPLIFLSAQLMLGRLPWLPGFIANRSLERGAFAALVTKMTPVLARAERLLSPRLTFMITPAMQQLIGVGLLVLSVVLALPIPLGNMLPAMAITIICLGILERDGLWVILGVLLGIVSLIVVWGVIWALVAAVVFLIQNAFG